MLLKFSLDFIIIFFILEKSFFLINLFWKIKKVQNNTTYALFVLKFDHYNFEYSLQ